MISEYYAPINNHTGIDILPCPFCGSVASLDEYHDGSGNVTKVVSCSNGGETEEQECLMYFPSQVAYKAKKREAIEIWNKRV